MRMNDVDLVNGVLTEVNENKGEFVLKSCDSEVVIG